MPNWHQIRFISCDNTAASLNTACRYGCTPLQVSVGEPAVEIHHSALVTEIRQSWAELNSSVITRLWTGSDNLEVEWTAAPPPVASEGYVNWELFIRYHTDIASGATQGFVAQSQSQWGRWLGPCFAI